MKVLLNIRYCVFVGLFVVISLFGLTGCDHRVNDGIVSIVDGEGNEKVIHVIITDYTCPIRYCFGYQPQWHCDGEYENIKGVTAEGQQRLCEFANSRMAELDECDNDAATISFDDIPDGDPIIVSGEETGNQVANADYACK